MKILAIKSQAFPPKQPKSFNHWMRYIKIQILKGGKRELR